MAGHSKWKQIKRKKAVTDARRASAWTKIIREITVAAKAGGGDPNGNPRLRLAIDSARAVNMPKENIEHTVKKGTSKLDKTSFEELTYEGYGPGGAAIFIEATTDNANRAVAEIRHAFSRNGGNLGASNSVGSELAMVPKNTVKVEGADAERILKLVESLEELEDVSKVFSNFDIDAAQLAEAEA